ncbi:MAG: peptide deformylase [Planctomycetes bacterium]|nr:peptide deformylase [Planctomycetota bacterium]
MKILTYPNPSLKRKSTSIKVFNKELAKIAKEMFQFMYKLNGVGLAATQVGLPYSIAVINPTRQPADEIVLINPRFTKTGPGTINEEEGCLSVPGISARVKRFTAVTCEYHNLKGEKAVLEARDLLARILQHEIDHLNGVLFIDRLGEDERKILLNKSPAKTKNESI